MAQNSVMIIIELMTMAVPDSVELKCPAFVAMEYERELKPVMIATPVVEMAVLLPVLSNR